MILVDTSVWSLALRKKEKSTKEIEIINFLAKQIRELNTVIIGPIRQEILCGISDEKKYEDLKQHLSVFEDQYIETKDYELAAKFYNKCRSKGIQGSHIDFLICAIAVNRKFTIFTLDNDFINFQKCLAIRLEKIA